MKDPLERFQGVFTLLQHLRDLSRFNALEIPLWSCRGLSFWHHWRFTMYVRSENPDIWVFYVFSEWFLATVIPLGSSRLCQLCNNAWQIETALHNASKTRSRGQILELLLEQLCFLGMINNYQRDAGTEDDRDSGTVSLISSLNTGVSFCKIYLQIFVF